MSKVLIRNIASGKRRTIYASDLARLLAKLDAWLARKSRQDARSCFVIVWHKPGTLR